MTQTVTNRLLMVFLAITVSAAAMGQAVTGVTSATGTEEQVATPIEEPSPNDLRELMRLLSDERVRHWLSEQAMATGETLEENDATGVSLREWLTVRLHSIHQHVALLTDAWRDPSGRLLEFHLGWSEELDEGEGLRSIVYVIVFLIVGAGLEWLYWRYAQPIRQRIEYATYENQEHRLQATFTRAGLAALGISLFAVGAVGGFLAFDWPPLAEVVVLSLLVAVVVIRLVNTVSVFVLCPRVSALRLISLSTPVARFVYWWTMLVVSVLCFGGLAAEAVTEMSFAPGADVIIGSSTGTLVAALLIAAVCDWRWRVAATPGIKQSAGRIATTAFSISFIAIAWAMWEIGARPPMWTLVVLIAFPFVERASRLLIAAFAIVPIADWKLATETTDPNVEAETIEERAPNAPSAAVENRPRLYAPVLERLVRFALVVLTVLTLGEIWALDLIALSDSSSIGGRVLSASIDILVAYLIADLLWVWAKTAIDARLADYQPPAPGHAPGPDARLAMLLPFVQKILMVTLLVMVGLIALSSLGVNVGPLLAGVGVLGIAVGFGAQTLVRDIVSGIFFLLDDAFRVGEYIEVDVLMGTVESISVRSLRLRHHRGAVHTIPFGEMTSLSNHSRDWVIMKLEFRVPFETDLKLVKNLVKEIGKDMQADPEMGPHILEPLKFQGVRRMEEFNMVVGVKFMASPGEQWTMRKVAYQKVRDAFDANGINFAERNVKVEVVGGESMTPQTRTAAAAAAQQVIEQQVGEQIPIPDEP